MSMSTHVIGIVPADAEYKTKLAAWDACIAAGVEPPKALCEFFGIWPGETPDPSGHEVAIEKSPGVSTWSEEAREGYEVDLALLAVSHPHVKRIRFYNSW